jgi:hypothetical protein
LLFGSIPSALIAVAKLFAANEGHEDRWYMQSRFSALYKSIGLIFLTVLIAFQLGVV